MKLISAAAIALAVVLSSGGALYPSGAQAQPSIQIGPGGVRVDDGRGRRGGGQCEELRLACENKDRLGEQGSRCSSGCRPQARTSRSSCGSPCRGGVETWARRFGRLPTCFGAGVLRSGSHCRALRPSRPRPRGARLRPRRRFRCPRRNVPWHTAAAGSDSVGRGAGAGRKQYVPVRGRGRSAAVRPAYPLPRLARARPGRLTSYGAAPLPTHTHLYYAG